jgi:dihydropyrimidinase
MMKNTESIHSLFDLVIHSGTLVTASDTFMADIGILDGKIALLGENLQGLQNIDASDKWVLPGGVDPHVHLEMPVGSTRSSDDWLTGTIAAACGGTTTIIDFAEPEEGETLEQALIARKELAESKAVIDFALHMTITNDKPATLSQIPRMLELGCSSFKTYLTYEGFRLSDPAFLHVLVAVRDAGGMVLVHAENDAIIQQLHEQFRRENKTAPKYHALSHPPLSEIEAIQRVIAMADSVNAQLYIVHMSTAGGAEAIRIARRQGITIYGETCPQYLLLTSRELERPDFEGAKFVCSPPLRSSQDNQVLWNSLSEGTLQTVGTDHCPFFFQGQKDLGRGDYEKIPGGLPGIEARLALIHNFGVWPGKISLNRWVQICSTNPAKIFGLYPQKGSLLPGADADIVVFDPNKRVNITQTLFHEQVDYTPYEGFELMGYPVLTVFRGKVIAENGIFLGKRGDGRYLARKAQA